MTVDQSPKECALLQSFLKIYPITNNGYNQWPVKGSPPTPRNKSTVTWQTFKTFNSHVNTVHDNDNTKHIGYCTTVVPQKGFFLLLFRSNYLTSIFYFFYEILVCCNLTLALLALLLVYYYIFTQFVFLYHTTRIYAKTTGIW